MFGVSGRIWPAGLPNSSQVPGLYNSTLWALPLSASQRIAVRQYFGAEVEHSRIVSFLKGTDSGVQSDNIFPFYTIYSQKL